MTQKINDRVSFQQEIRSYLLQKRIPNIDRTDGFDELDFEIIISGVNFHLEVKEKRQRYNLSNWDWEDGEENLVIIDELSVRKCLRVAPYSGILIQDYTRDRYIFYRKFARKPPRFSGWMNGGLMQKDLVSYKKTV